MLSVKPAQLDQEAQKYYEEKFQKKLAAEIDLHYKNKVQSWLKLSTPEYVVEAQKHLVKEEEIAKKYYSKSEQNIIAVIQKKVIIDVAEMISNSETGIHQMFN